MPPKLLYILFLLLANSGFSQNKKQVQKALESIQPNAIRGTMSFLADDLIEGRQPGTRGFALASKYVASQFISLGLQPAVNNRDYVQRFTFQKGIINLKESKFVFIDGTNREEWTHGKEFILNPYMPHEQSEVTASLVFVGFGISAPELGYDDYKDIDVSGKIVMYISQAPESFGTTERAYFSSASVKLQEALKRGAVGVINFSNNSRTSWDATLRRTAQGNFTSVGPGNKPLNAFEGLKAVATINPQSLKKLFSRSGKDFEGLYNVLKNGTPQSFPLNVSVQMKAVTQHSFIETSNLAGIIPGSDPKLKEEYIVYAAHIDHFGIGNAVKGDSIYNGAHDNASGVAILLEIARTFKSLPVAPKRSIIIAVVTGEEYGLLGSDYFVNNPPVNGTIVANLSIDMPFFFHPILDFVPYGMQHSSLSKHVSTAAEMLNLKISPDPFPEQVVFIRSDHYSFVKKGIPALFIKSGFMTIDTDTVNRAKSDVGWRSSIYHTPQDDMSQAFDYNAAATHVKLNFLIGLFAANDANRPKWNEGDFFGKRFEKK